MRTTITIDDALLAEAKIRAARSGRTLGSIVEEALRVAFAGRASRDAVRPSLPVHRGGRLMPGIDLDDSASLLEHMDRPRR